MTIPVAASVFRRYATDGVPSSGPNQPDKTQIIALLTALETISNIGAGLAYSNLSEINADLLHQSKTLALVYNDATAANNGMYVKNGASGVGSWSRAADLPTSLVRLTVTGGTGDAIIATALETPTLPGSKLYLLAPTAANTTTTTIAVNGASPVAIKNAFGLDLAANSLVTSGQVLMAWQTDHYQILISAQVDASSILASALAEATASATSATASATSATNAASSASALGNQVHQYDTRALAIAATIPSGVNFVRTLAYDSSFIPNSGATFVRVASGTPFLDSYPLTGTIVGGSGYVNGIYFGVPLGGGVGLGLVAVVTVSGGAVTAVSHATCPGNGYAVGDVVTAPTALVGGSGSGFTYTIATVSTSTASFTNGGGSLWQYIADRGGPWVEQFGAKPDNSTNAFTAFQTALFLAGRVNGTNFGAGGFQGGRVQVGAGVYKFFPSPAASLIVPFGVFLEGQIGGTQLRCADAFDGTTHFITLGDPNSHLACFQAGLRNLSLFTNIANLASNGTSMVYSNNTQDGGGLESVYIFAGQRGGIKYEIGYGGASEVHFWGVSINYAGTNAGVSCNVGTTVMDFRRLVVGGPSSGTNNTINAIELTGSGGMYNFDGGHVELIPTGFNVNLTGSAMVSIKNWDGGNGVTELVLLNSTNSPGNLSLQQCALNGATRMVTNGQSGGSSRATDVRPKDGIVFFNP